MPRGKGKRGLVELRGASSTDRKQAPEVKRFVKNNFCDSRNKSFYYSGKLNGKCCSFKIDTGSDVSIINSQFVNDKEKKLEIGNLNLKYPTGEKVSLDGKVLIKVEIGKFSLEIPAFVATINDDCLLGADFLEKINLRNIFDSVFGEIGVEEKNLGYPQEVNFFDKASSNFKEFLKCNSTNLNDVQKETFTDFVLKFKDLFSEEIVAGNCEILEHKINVNNSSPIKQVPRRIPIQMRGEVEKIIEEMRKQKVIEKSQSPWTSPAVLVKKKDGTLRFCVDYRKLNEVTVKDSYPLPRIDDIFDQLSGNLWFSTLDLKSGYWQIKIREEDKEKTAFSVGKGLWQFNVMPFGLCNAPATFERLMDEVLKEFRFCRVYLDDVIIFAKSFEEMLENLEKVFQRMREVNLKVNPKKCVLFAKNVKYLGHIISANGISTDPEKVSAVKNWPEPHTKKLLRSFLGFCSYYRKFIKDFSSLAKPLYALTEKQAKFFWNTECRSAFENLKQVLSSSPILSFPREEGKFILDTDASNISIGAVLSQRQEEGEKVIAYFSRTLNKAERNYCVTRRELLAIVDSVKFFRHYLLGRKFSIRTDHISLRWLMSFKDLEGQLARWLERLQQYEFEIIYRKGQIHKNADGLSRRQCEASDCEYCARVEKKNAYETEKTVSRIILSEGSLEDWRREQKEDLDISAIYRGKEVGIRPPHSEIDSKNVSAQIYWNYWDALSFKNGILYKKWYAPNLKTNFLQLVVPRKRIKEILEQAHDSSSGGHFGINKTLERIRKRFYWATCKQDVENWCKSCKICIAKKGPTGKGKSPLQIDGDRTPFERIQMDILGPLPTTLLGNRYLLVIVDCFTKWVEAFPLRNIRAKTVAEIFVSQVISRHGVPMEVHTDQGRNFESRLFAELMDLLGIKKTRTTALHPQSDGQVERQHQTIINFLAKYISENQKDWDRWIPMFLLAYRSSKHEATGVTPAELYFARDLRLPLDLLIEGPPDSCEREPQTIGSYVERLKSKLEEIHSSVRERLRIKSTRVKTWYDRKVRQISFEVGQKVWLFNPRRQLGKSPKLQRNWEGPYFIVKKLSEVVYGIRKTLRHRSKIVHSDRLAPFTERVIH